MREITTHCVKGEPNGLTLIAQDIPGPGGANYRYAITGFDAATHPAAWDEGASTETVLLFQNGPVAEVGINGITQEALIAVMMDRLEAFQTGPYACKENQCALEHLGKALDALQVRTLKRLVRGIEGTTVKHSDLPVIDGVRKVTQDSVRSGLFAPSL